MNDLDNGQQMNDRESEDDEFYDCIDQSLPIQQDGTIYKNT